MNPEQTESSTSFESENRSRKRQDAIYKNLGVENLVIPSLDPTPTNPKRFKESIVKSYNFTTENIAAYILELTLQGKRVAAVCGSGDFPISAYMYGASLVDAFDIMPSSCLYGELKVAGLQSLSYQEFLTFFGTTGNAIFGPESFSNHTYEKMKDLLSQTARIFFDQLISPHGRHPYMIPNGFLITKLAGAGMNAHKTMVPYLIDEEAYQQAQRALKPILFYPQEVSSFLSSDKRGKYDLVYLSNISAYGTRGKKPAELLAKSILPVGGDVIQVQPGVPDLRKSTRKWMEGLMHQDEREFGMKGRTFLVPMGYKGEHIENGANAINIFTKQPSILDRLFRPHTF